MVTTQNLCATTTLFIEVRIKRKYSRTLIMRNAYYLITTWIKEIRAWQEALERQLRIQTNAFKNQLTCAVFIPNLQPV